LKRERRVANWKQKPLPRRWGGVALKEEGGKRAVLRRKKKKRQGEDDLKTIKRKSSFPLSEEKKGRLRKKEGWEVQGGEVDPPWERGGGKLVFEG